MESTIYELILTAGCFRKSRELNVISGYKQCILPTTNTKGQNGFCPLCSEMRVMGILLVPRYCLLQESIIIAVLSVIARIQVFNLPVPVDQKY